jgi:hypothetical protein
MRFGIRSLAILVLAISLLGCGANTLEVCNNDGNCSTGWYDHNGNIVTTAHGFDKDELLNATSSTGYEARGLQRVRVLGPDVVVYQTDGTYRPKVCYAEVEVGDRVTVSTTSGVVRTKIRSKGMSVYYLDAIMKPGDSGAPVSSWGCIVGVVRAKTKTGTLVVAIRHD